MQRAHDGLARGRALVVEAFALRRLDGLGLGILARMRLARARRAWAGRARVVAARRGYARVGPLVVGVWPLGRVGVGGRLAERAVRLGLVLGHGRFLALTPAVQIGLLLGHGNSFV